MSSQRLVAGGVVGEEPAAWGHRDASGPGRTDASTCRGFSDDGGLVLVYRPPAAGWNDLLSDHTMRRSKAITMMDHTG